ncbi:MAG: nucleotidyl transferase AbiEii/AbiGii toxin family protein [Acidimicrobiia bacterium]
MLTPLQERIATIFAALPEASDFALAGGAALIVRGDVDRETRDLDFFATTPAAVNRLLPRFEEALEEAGMAVEHQQVSHGFVRLEVSASGDQTTVDLCYDSRIRPAESSRLGPVMAGEELAAGKLLALFSRALARDFVDVHHLARLYGFERLCELAVEKDPGFDLAALADALGAIRRLSRSEFDVDDVTFERLEQAVAGWRVAILGQLEEQ